MSVILKLNLKTKNVCNHLQLFRGLTYNCNHIYAGRGKIIALGTIALVGGFLTMFK